MSNTSIFTKMYSIAAKNWSVLEEDINRLKEQGFERIFLESVKDSVAYGLDVSNLLKNWENQTFLTSSMPAIMHITADYFKINKNSNSFMLAHIAGNLGSIPTKENVIFHAAPDHPRKVLLQTIRLISTHNELVDQGDEDNKLDERDICLLMAAAAIHDLEHDGRGNSPEGKHIPYRLEDQAFKKFKGTVGDQLSEDDLRDLQVMLKCTDVTSSNGPFAENCPTNLLKRFYKKEIGVEDLPNELKGLAGNKKLVLMALILQTADIATSAGLSCERSTIESRKLADETGVDDIAKPESSQRFIEGAHLTLLPVGRAVYGKNLENICNELTKLRPS